MRVVSSAVVSLLPQADGRVIVLERQTYDTGSIQDFEYLASPNLDFQAVADQRAANINATIEAKEAVLLAANNFEAPITVRDFLDKLTAQERKDLRALAKTNPDLEDAMDYLYAGPEVFKIVAQVWLQGLVPGVFTQSRVDSILGNW